MHIRPLRYADIAQYEQLAVASFGQQVDVVGEGEAEIRKQFRLMRFGRMIPFKVLMSLAGDKSETLMAEQNGSVIGSVTYSMKNKRALISGVMVAEAFQNRGIGTTLVAECEAKIKEADIESIQADIAFENIASRRIFEKQGFNLFSHHRNFEGKVGIATGDDQQFLIRKIDSSDEASVEKLISQAVDAPEQIRTQARGFLKPTSPLMYLMGVAGGYSLHRGVVEKAQKACGANQVVVSKNQELAHVRQLFVADQDVGNLPAILQAIAGSYSLMRDWTMRVSLLAQQAQIIEWFTGQGSWSEHGGEAVYRKEL